MSLVSASHFPGDRLFLIAGPCQLEDDTLNLRVGEALARLAEHVPGGVIFKASFDKANRSNIDGVRGPGIEAGLAAPEGHPRMPGAPLLGDQTEDAAVLLDQIVRRDLFLGVAQARKRFFPVTHAGVFHHHHFFLVSASI